MIGIGLGASVAAGWNRKNVSANVQDPTEFDWRPAL
jgi:hypothetical protein